MNLAEGKPQSLELQTHAGVIGITRIQEWESL